MPTQKWPTELAAWDTTLFSDQFSQLTSSDHVYVNVTHSSDPSFFSTPNPELAAALPAVAGSFPTTRDILGETLDAIDAAGKKAIVYFACEGFADANGKAAWMDYIAQFGMTYTTEGTREFIVRYYSKKYGDKIDGWWFDGSNEITIRSGPNEAQLWKDAVRSGNPNAICAFNKGSYPNFKSTDVCDYFGGHPIPRTTAPFWGLENYHMVYDIEAGPWLDTIGAPVVNPEDGALGHIFMGMQPNWTAGDLAFPEGQAIDWTKRVVEAGGMYSWAIPRLRTGNMSEMLDPQFQLLLKIDAAIRGETNEVTALYEEYFSADPGYMSDNVTSIGAVGGAGSYATFGQYNGTPDIGVTTGTGVLHIDSNTSGGSARSRGLSLFIDTSAAAAGTYTVSFDVSNWVAGTGTAGFKVLEGSGLDTGYIQVDHSDNNANGSAPNFGGTASSTEIGSTGASGTGILGNGTVSFDVTLSEAGQTGDYLALAWTQVRSTDTAVAPTFDIDNVTINSPSAPAYNAPPVASTQSVGVMVNSFQNVTLTGYDPEGNNLTYSVVDTVSNGALSGTVPDLIYTPNTDYFGNDSFTFTVNDGELNSNPATVNIVIAPPNQAPVFAVDPINEANATEDIAYAGSVANATDAEGDTLSYSKLTGPTWLSVGTDGSLSGTPLDGDTGANVFTVEVDDGNGGTDTATLNITVDAVNDAPVFAVDPINEANATEGIAYVGSVANATDAEDDTLSYSKLTGPAWLSVGTDGSLSGTPEQSDAGANVFTVKVDDGNGGTDTATLNITVDVVNDAPVFTVDPINAASATADIAYAGSVANAIDAEGDTLSYSKLTGPAWLTVGTDGSLSGTPTQSDVGANVFTVQVDDGNGGTATATVSILVNAEGTLYSEGFSVDPGYTNGTTSIGAAGGAGTYFTFGDYNGSGEIGETTNTGVLHIDSNTSGGSARSRGLSVFIDTSAAVAGTYTVSFDVSNWVAGTGTAGFKVLEGSSLDSGYINLDNGDNNTTGSAPNFSGTATSTVLGSTWGAGTAGTGISSNGTVSLEVTLTAAGQAGDYLALAWTQVRSTSTAVAPKFDVDNVWVGAGSMASPPSFTSDPINEVNAIEDVAYSSTIADDASDPDSDPMTFSKLSGPAWLSVGTDGSLSGTPAQSDAGANVFTVQVDDGNGGTDTATLNITVDAVNDAPVFTVDPINEANATEDIAYAGSVANATDAEDDTLTYSTVSGPAWLSVGTDGSLSGTPAQSDAGANVFTVQVDDGNGGTDSATLNISVNAVNDAPVFTVDPINEANATEDIAYAGSVANATDAEDDTLSYSKLTGPTWLSVGTDGSLSGTPAQSDAGANVFTIQVSDGNGGTGTATLNITVDAVNDAPVFAADPINEANATEGIAYAGSVANATDAEDDTLSYSKLTGPAWLSVGTDGSLSGTPAQSDAGANVFTVEVDDSNGGTDTATLNITVDAVNDAPVFTVDPIGTAEAIEDVEYSATIAGSATDADSDPLTYSKLSGPAWLTVASDGALSGTPLDADVGANSWTVQVDDGNGNTDTATLDITVDEFIVADLAVSGVQTLGTSSGTLADTYASDDVYQVLTESGDPSALEYEWTFNVLGGELVTVYVEAYHTANSEGDDFVFAYSTNGTDYIDMGIVIDTVDDDTMVWYALPSGTSGTVTVRVLDADRTGGNTAADSLYVDEIYIVSEDSTVAPAAANTPVPASGTVDVAINQDLAWTAGAMTVSHDVYFGTTPTPGAPELQGNQSGIIFDPGVLAYSTTYYWAIDEVNLTGTTAGPVWSFTTAAPANTAPQFDSDPVVEAAATENTVYNATLVDDASDVDNDPLTFSKVSGPAWLSVAADGTLSGTPGSSDLGTNSWTVQVLDGIDSDITTLEIIVEAASPSWTELTNDDFEGGFGNWSDGGSDARLSTSYAIDSQCFAIQDNSNSSEVELSSSLDLTSYSELKIEFSYVVKSFESSEDFWVRFSDDGGLSWTTIKAYVNDVDFVDDGTRYPIELTIDSGSYTFSNDVKIMFECDASGNNDDVYIDNVIISVQ
jgi:hypothetical protein